MEVHVGQRIKVVVRCEATETEGKPQETSFHLGRVVQTIDGKDPIVRVDTPPRSRLFDITGPRMHCDIRMPVVAPFDKEPESPTHLEESEIWGVAISLGDGGLLESISEPANKLIHRLTCDLEEAAVANEDLETDLKMMLSDIGDWDRRVVNGKIDIRVDADILSAVIDRITT